LVPLEYVQGGIDGDYNGNDLVEQADLDLVLGNWGRTLRPPAWINDLPTGTIDQEELDGVLGNWGQGFELPARVQAGAVPEPGTWMLCLNIFVLLITARLRRTRA
jgi:hypothetical protein